ncbi:MAG: AMP-binding protein [Verrucomicrobiales bacterium]
METADLAAAEVWESDANAAALNPALGEDAGAWLRAADAAGVRGSVLFQTSGTTGAPRMACLPRSALLASARAVSAHLGLGAADRWLCALPTFHVGGFSIYARAFAGGGEVVAFSGKWDAARFAAELERGAITATSLVPTQVHDLVRARLPCPTPLRVALVGGGALPEATAGDARALGWPLLRTYGMTEACSQIATESPGSPTAPWLPILPIWEARADAEGVLSLRGAALFAGYLERGGAFHRAPDWFRTSDCVALEGGKIRFLGRADRSVKILGELVNLDTEAAAAGRLLPERGSARISRSSPHLIRAAGTATCPRRRSARDPRRCRVRHGCLTPVPRPSPGSPKSGW